MFYGLLGERLVKELRKIGIVAIHVDAAIDKIRKMYNIVIYNRAEPYVDCLRGKTYGKILYNFAVKKCSSRDGWNGRVYIPSSKVWDSNIYRAKRRAIKAAITWILAHKCQKISIKTGKK